MLEPITTVAMLSIKKGEIDRAAADYSKAIQFKPNFVEAYNNRGLIFCQNG